MGFFSSILGWLADKLAGRALDGALDRPRFHLTAKPRPAVVDDGVALGPELLARIKALGADMNVEVARIETEQDMDRIPVLAFINGDLDDERAVLPLPIPISEGIERPFIIPLDPVRQTIARRRPDRRGERVDCYFIIRDKGHNAEKKSSRFALDIPPDPPPEPAAPH